MLCTHWDPSVFTSVKWLSHVICSVFITQYTLHSRPGSVVGLPTGLTVGGSNPGVGEIFRTFPDLPWGPPSLLYNGYRVFTGVKSGRGVTLTPHSLLVPWSRKSRVIPLLPLWAVRPVQILSACTRMHFFSFTHYIDHFTSPPSYVSTS